jgi:oligoendopeptidase F
MASTNDTQTSILIKSASLVENTESQHIDSSSFQKSISSPNSKLPPLRNPKSKLIMKAFQSKQNQEQLVVQQQSLANQKFNQTTDTNSTNKSASNNNDSQSVTVDPMSNLSKNVTQAEETVFSVNNDTNSHQNDENKQTANIKIQRSISSSSVLERR